MSRFRLVRHLLASAGTSYLTPSYDTRWGSSTDANGWITFDHTGATLTWVDSVNGNDANNGSSAALAKKTYDAAVAVFKSTYVLGTQSILMVAGGPGRSYTNNGDTTGSLGTMHGNSLAHPLLQQSYDPSDPTNAAKYGRLTGANLPMIVLNPSATNGYFAFWGSTAGAGTGTNYAFSQGIGFDGQDTANIDFGFSGKYHNGIGFQNFRLKQVMLSLECGDGDWQSAPGAHGARDYSSNFHLSKGSAWGQWKADGNKSAIYLHGLNGLIAEDLAVLHGGWRMIRTRSDTGLSTGAAGQEGHGIYYHPENDPGNIFRRITYGDNAADGANFRGGLTGNCLVSLNEPIAGQVGGFSFSYGAGDYSEAPAGVRIQITDRLIVGGKNLNSSTPRGGGFGNQNTVSGSFIDNLVAFDNPIKGTGNSTSLVSPASNTANIAQYLTISRARTWNYADTLETDGGTATSHINMTYTNCITEQLAPGAGNVLATTGLFPGRITYSQLIAQMGFASEAAMFNAILWRPDLQWAQALITQAFSAYGATPTYVPVSPPDMTGETPATVY